MSPAEPIATPPSRTIWDAGLASAAAGNAPRAPSGPAVEGRAPLDPEALARACRVDGATAPTRWRRALSRLTRLWLLLAFIAVWEVVSIFGERINPQLDVMMPPPTAVISAAADLLARGVLFTHIFASLSRVLLAVGAATPIGRAAGPGDGVVGAVSVCS